jgi:hypothetical protein
VQLWKEIEVKFRMTEDETAVAMAYWGKVYGPPQKADVNEALHQSQTAEPEASQDAPEKNEKEHLGRSSIWREEWVKLLTLSSIADNYSVSMTVLRKIFMVAGNTEH